MDHVLDVLIHRLHLNIDRGIIATSVFDDYLVFKADLHEFIIV